MRPSSQPTRLDRGTVTYDEARVVITPEGPFHYDVTVCDADGNRTDHAVEYVAINATLVRFEDTIWFIDADLDVGIPVGDAGETAWVWP